MFIKWFKLSQHHHSGRLRPHEYTSYLPLFLLEIFVGVALSSFTVFATGTPAVPGPTAGSIGLSGTMPSKPPTVAATIKTPSAGQHFPSSPIIVSGTCVADNLVELFKNDIFAGSTICTTGGNYSIEIDPLIGQNTLIARVYDANNQAGPDSNAVSIYYDAVPPQSSALTSLNFGSNQLLLNTDSVFRGAFPDQQLNIPISIIGGTPPFAVNVQWGDAANNIVPRNDNIQFTAAHAYNKPGTYQINLQASDTTGLVGFMTVAAIVNGQPTTIASTNGTSDSGTTTQLLTLWPLYVGSVAVLGSFWLGERREKRILARVPVYYH